MKRKKRSPFAVDENGKTLFIQAKASGIHPLVQLIDGIPYVTFKGDKSTYLRVTDAIDWHKKELAESHGQSGNAKVLGLLRESLANFEAGRVVEEKS